MYGPGIHVLHNDPLIVVTPSNNSLMQAIPYASSLSNGKTAYVFVQLYWTAQVHLQNILAAARVCAERSPNVHLTVMAASPEDEALFRANGLDAIVSNHNAFLDERRMYPEPGVLKKYDAVYNGRFHPSKRHELAANVKRLALLSAFHDVTQDDIARVHELCKGTVYSNLEIGQGGRLLLHSEVRRKNNEAICGLALSHQEGAMYASAEYLLCGIPVVSTPSRGGRHVFFHPDYVSIVAEDPAAVAEGVERFKRQPVDPVMVRTRTLRLMKDHRVRFILKLSGILQHDLSRLADSNGWLPFFTHKLQKPNLDGREAEFEMTPKTA